MSTQVSKKFAKKNQLHEVDTYNVDNMFFGEPELFSIPGNSNVPINFHRINVYTKNQDEDGEPTGSVGDLVLKFPRMFSFGLSANKDEKSGKVTGHSMSLCMWSREGATEQELKATTLMENIIKKCKEKVFASRKELKKPKMEMSDLKKMDKILYWKEDEDGNRIPGIGPMFSPKLVEFKESVDKQGKTKPHQIVTVFYDLEEVDEEGYPKQVSPLEYISDKSTKNYCYVTPAIKIDNIFIGGTAITIQCKIYEADVESAQQGKESYLHPRSLTTKAKSDNQHSDTSNSKHSNEEEDEDEEDEDEEDNEL